jgi:hypothetical protein
MSKTPVSGINGTSQEAPDTPRISRASRTI